MKKTHAIKILQNTLKNIVSTKTKLLYIVEPADWSIKWDGEYITNGLNSQFNIKAGLTTSRFCLYNKILHFGSLGTFIKENGIVKVHPSNKVVFTWFHVADNEKRLKYVKELNKKADFVHTSCNITKNILIRNGLNEEKIIVVPIGVDTSVFKPYNVVQKNKLKDELQLPENKIIIGSFQKDGVGWEEGYEPKLIKGPDIFCSLVERLAKKYDIHVLLTGPARGYVKNRLKKSGISFSHHFLKKYHDIVDFYNVLDLYIISSRVEGGPKALTECMACGVPVVASKVGMVPEIIQDGINGFIADVEDINALEEKSAELIENSKLKERIIRQALNDVSKYTWEITNKALYYKIYSKLL